MGNYQKVDQCKNPNSRKELHKGAQQAPTAETTKGGITKQKKKFS
jgi:hypothetical protein